MSGADPPSNYPVTVNVYEIDDGDGTRFYVVTPTSATLGR